MALDHIVQPFWLSVRLNDADKETRSKRALFPLTIYDLFTSACSASIRTAKVSRYELSYIDSVMFAWGHLPTPPRCPLGQKLTSDSRQAESALNGPS